MAQMYIRRLKAELADFQKNSNISSGIQLEDVSNLTLWKIHLTGAPDTLYSNEEYVLQFKFSEDYPIEAPEVVFLGDPPVNEHVYSNGHICLSILYDQWSPALTVSAICLSILSMLSSSKCKCRPPDNDDYVKYCRGSPKKTLWAYHDEC